MRARSFLANRTPVRPHGWHMRDGGKQLAYDRALIRSRYPDLLIDVDNIGQVQLHGVIVLRAECGVEHVFAIRGEFPSDYPNREPRIFDIGSQFPYEADRHFLQNGRCCLWLPCETQWRADKPDALLDLLDQVVVFYDRQLVYDALPVGRKRWPGPERGHGMYGHVEVVLERLNGNDALLKDLAPVFSGRKVGRNMPCPCGSGNKYKRCHETEVKSIRSFMGDDVLRFHFQNWLKLHAAASPSARTTQHIETNRSCSLKAKQEEGS